MAERPVNFVVAVEGADDAARDFQALKGAQEQATRSTSAMSREQDKAKQKTEALQRALSTQIQGWGSLGSAVSQVGATIGQIGPQFSGFAQTLGQAGQSVSSVATALASPSPASLTTALLSVASTLASGFQAWERYRDGIDDARRAAAESVQTHNQLARALRDQREAVESGREATDLDLAAAAVAQRRLELGRAQVEVNRLRAEGEQDAFQAADRARAQAQAALDNAVNAEQQISRELARQSAQRAAASAEERELAQLRQEQAQILADQNALIEEQEGLRDEATRSRAGGSQRRRAAELLREFEMQIEAERIEAFHAEVAAEQAALDARYDANVRFQERLREAEQTYDRQQAERRKAALQEAQEQRVRRLEESKAAAREAMDQIKADAEGVLGPAISQTTQALSNIIAGAENADQAFQGLLASFLEMLAQQAALEAAKEFAAAIGSFASQDYGGGALHLAAGAAWTGVAIAAGAGAVAAAPSEAVPASPEAARDTGGGGGGGDTVYNINGTIISADGPGARARAGREVGALLGEGQRRYGRAG